MAPFYGQYYGISWTMIPFQLLEGHTITDVADYIALNAVVKHLRRGAVMK